MAAVYRIAAAATISGHRISLKGEILQSDHGLFAAKIGNMGRFSASFRLDSMEPFLFAARFCSCE
jgi:hypothetical protein